MPIHQTSQLLRQCRQHGMWKVIASSRQPRSSMMPSMRTGQQDKMLNCPTSFYARVLLARGMYH
jgi:hypothetical protein